jgi:hypothetical protein
MKVNPPVLGNAPREYNRQYFDMMLGALRSYFDRLNRPYAHDASTVNINIDTLPTEADTATLRYGDVYRDTTVSDVLRVWRSGAAPWVWGGGGGTVTKGSATLDFGASPGSSEASVTITGQASIALTSTCRAFILGDATSADHTASDHRYAAILIGLTTGNIVAGTGFTIYGRGLDKLEGEFTINWEWS